MRNSIQRLSIAVLLSVTFVATSCMTSLSGVVREEKRDLTGFTSIDLAVPANLQLTQGKSFNFTIEADKDILDKIETQVHGKTLMIKTERGFNFVWGNSKINIHITMPEVESLSVSGSGKIDAVTPIVAKELSSSISGSGLIRIDNLTLNSLSANVSGSGSLKLNGIDRASDANITISGSGNVKVEGIEFDDANITLSGSGRAALKAKENLKARISGSGIVTYEGNPLVDAKVSGSGKIRNK